MNRSSWFVALVAIAIEARSLDCTTHVCRVDFHWAPGKDCVATTGVIPSDVVGVLASNEKEFGEDFAIIERPPVPGNGANTACSIHAGGEWSRPVSVPAVRQAAQAFRRVPQTDCELEDLEVLGYNQWVEVSGGLQLSNKVCTIARLTHPFDTLGQLWLAAWQAAERRGDDAAEARHPRVDLAGDAATRSLFLRIVAYMRRQPVTVDTTNDRVATMRYIMRERGDSFQLRYRDRDTRLPPAYVDPDDDPANRILFELNYVAVMDSADRGSIGDLGVALDALKRGAISGSLLLATVGVGYVPSASCAMDSAPFARGLMEFFQELHEAIQTAMPLDAQGVVTTKGHGLTLVTLGALIPDLAEGDLVPKRNAYAKSFVARHRKPLHTLYVDEGDPVPQVRHTKRRLGHIDFNTLVEQDARTTSQSQRFGSPQRATTACVVGADGRLIRAGGCHDWAGLGAFQLLLNYALADFPQW
jgi:hypothetical protein